MAFDAKQKVPDMRTIKLRRTSAGLVGESNFNMQVGETVMLAYEFANDLDVGGFLSSLDSVNEKSGPTFVTAAVVGIEGTKAKVSIVGDAAGTAVVQALVTYNDTSVVEGDATIVVVA